MIMALILVRVLVVAVCYLVAFVGGLILCGIGAPDRALGLVATCALIAWMGKPDAEEMAAFNEFQKQRLARHGIEI